MVIVLYLCDTDNFVVDNGTTGTYIYVLPFEVHLSRGQDLDPMHQQV